MKVAEQTKPARTADQNRALLAARLRAAGRKVPAELSFAQQRLWFLDQLEPNSPLYNVATVVRFKGDLQVSVLEEAINSVIGRHEALRTRFICRAHFPEQVIERGVRLQMTQVDLRHLAAGEQEAEARRRVRQEMNRPFNLSEDLLLRAALVRLGDQKHLLVLVMHHIVSDEWSLKIFFREMSEFYRARLEGRAALLPELPIQYSDYSAWQRKWLEGGVLAKQTEFWKRQLGENVPATELPGERPRPAVPSFRGQNASLTLSAELSRGAQELATSQKATLFMVLLSCLKVLIHRYTGQDVITVGSPIAGRNRVELEGLIGFFVNTLALRSNLAGGPSFRELLARVRESTLEAFANQDVPFVKLVELLHPQRSLSHMPFTRIMFAVQNRGLEETCWPGLALEFLPVEADTAKFDLTLVVQDTAQGLVLRAEYSADLFDPPTVERLLLSYKTLLETVVRDPDQSIERLSLLTPQQREQLIQWGASPASTGAELLHMVFERQAARNPEAMAVVFGSEEYTYAELNARANQLARYLGKLGCGQGTPVGLCVTRSADMVLAMLGILKAGGVYVPMDPTYPKERLEFMLKDTGTTVLLTQHKLLSQLPLYTGQTVCLDADWELISRHGRDNGAGSGDGESLAYIIYTSGSTGVPKGVAVPHRAVARLVLGTDYVELSSGERVAQVSNISFDAATFEIWGALLNGGQLIGITKDVALSPLEFARELKARQIRTLFLTTALFNQVASECPAAFSEVQNLLFGGEAVDPKWVRAVLAHQPPARLLHVYGPTENTTFSTWHLVSAVDAEATTVPIGKPVAGTECYVLSPERELVPAGAVGELYLGGQGLACGYWQRGNLTAEKFVENPLGREAKGGRLYRTGDLARWLGDGTLEFLGRLDDQVKIRGFRIEPGEIESVLGRHPGVGECVVRVWGEPAGAKRLVAYLVARNGTTPNTSELRRYVSAQLPDYMTPSAFVWLPALPLNANGKVDRSALPEPEQSRPELERRYAPPRDAVEERLVRIWQEVLKVSPIGVEDKFFDLGGHSLLAVRVIAEIEKAFGKKLRLATIFQAPTIEQLAAIIREEIKEASVTHSTSLVEIRAQGSRRPLFLVHGAGGGMFWGYINLSSCLGLDQPVYGFKSRGLDGREEFASIHQMAAQYISDLKSVQPTGPYHLGGYCFGGNVAYEMACQLRQQGETVELLALFNCAPPNSRYGQIPWTPKWGVRLVQNLFYWAKYFKNWNPSQRREFFRWKWSVLKNRFRQPRRVGQGESVEVGNLVDLSSYTAEQRKVWEAHIQALARFHPTPFDGCVHLFRSPGHPLWCSFDPDYGWGEFARGGVKVTVVPAVHEKILEEPCVQVLAGHLSSSLAEKEPQRETLPAERMALLKGVVLRASLFWLGAEGVMWQVENPGLGAQGLTLGVLFEHLVVLGGMGIKTAPAIRPAGVVAEAGRGPETTSGKPAETIVRELPKDVVGNLQQLSHKEGVSLALVLLAGCRALLGKYTRTADSYIKALSQLEKTDPVDQEVRCEVNELVFRTSIAGEPTFRALVGQMRDHAPGSGRLAAHPGHSGRTPFLDLYVGAAGKSVPATDESPEGSDFSLSFDQADGTVMVRLVYNPGLFEPGAAVRLVDHFEALLQTVAANPDIVLRDVLLLSRAERQQVLVKWNNTGKELRTDSSFAVQFTEQARRSPSSVAVRQNGTAMTYGELNEQANRLAHYLQHCGVGPEILVGVCLERSIDLIVALLAVWKAGGAYVPLDPNYPPERLLFMTRDARPTVLISRHDYLEIFDLDGMKAVCLEDSQVRQELSTYPAHDPELRAASENLAYVIYTSGSTGNPKGVQITHKNLLNHNHAVAELYKLEAADRVLQFSPISFDISVEEIFPTLLLGGTLVLRDEADISSLDRFLKLVTREGVTVLNLPTAYWHELVEFVQANELPRCVRLVVIGGEKASNEAFRRWKRKTGNSVILLNSYGPTETTVTATVYSPGAEDDVLAIGRPIANMQAVVLDAHLQPVPVGVPGELYIGGAGVGRGYLNRPELTAERFIRNPIPELPTERLYKTGDLVCLLPDGNLQFLGRVDHQVKIRGFRIELGEIESVLQSHAEVRDAVVTAREDVPGQKRLVAYVVPRPGVSPAVSDLLAYVRGKLPAYMVPAAFMTLSELPMTPSGKVDRRALPKPGNQRPALAEEFVAPRNATEELLGGIWCEVLGVDQVGVHDSFFDLGGHSLLATQLLGRVSDAFKAEVSLACLFSAPTISSLAETLGQAAGHSAVLHLATRNKVRQAPLSLSQKRIWFLDQFDPKQSPYNMPLGVRLSGKLDRRALEQSLSHVARRHEALRSVFPAQEGQPVQWVLEPGEVTVQLVDLKHLPPGERAESAKALAAEEARKPHVLHHPMMRAVLFNVSSSEHWLVLILHEIAADAESIRLVFQELLSCYASFVEKGCAAELPSVADNEELNGAQVDCSAKEYERGMRYWKQQLTGAPPVLELPADYPRPALWADAGGRVPVRLPVELCAGVKRVSAAQGCDASTVLLAAFQALLARYTGVEDVVVGSKLSCRSNPLLKTVVGRYSNQVALRANLADAPSFCELVNRAKTRVQEAIEHVGVPFGEIVETLHPERDLSRTPIFQVFFEFDENPVRTAKAVGVEFRPIEIGNHTAKFDLTLHLEYRDGQISGWFEYSTSLFHVDRIERMARHFERLLGGALEEPETRLWDLPLLPEQEAARMLMDWNRTERPLPAGQTLVDLMAEQTRRSADRVAVVDGTQRLTYGQLCARAAVIAGALRAQGVGNQMRAGICLERSWEMLASILGTLRAGAAYVPMDPAYPAERLGYMARDAGLRVVITSRRVKATLPDVEAKVLYIEDIQWDRPAVAPMDLEDPKPKPTDLAYVIYTSGSTGDPKGVAIEHRNAVALMEWARGQFDKEELSGVLASTSICFDLSVFEMFAPLCWGGKIILALNVLALPGLPAAQEVRLVNTVPSALRELLRIRGVPAGVCTINLAGEPLASSLVDQIYGETAVRKVYDLYGPTETTTYSTGTLRRAGEPANIGRPLPNEKVYVLGMGLQPVPIGNPGELYIGGAGVARGYLNRAELTAEKFVPNPFIAGERLYKTGDLVRWRADGVLEYLGRIDHQVKIRGFRIEPGEIQFVLRNHSALSDAVVVPWTAQGDTRLIAYLELKEGVQVEAEAIRNWLSNYLPGYMVPAEFIFLDALPLTPNGKIDRKRLPPPEAVREESGRPCVPPRNAIEERLVEIWKEVLGLQRVSVQDKFFDLGGHSLLAVRMIARIRDVFKVELPLYGVFEAATIENLALGLSERRWSPEQQLVLPLTPRPEGSEVPPSFVQERLWFLDQLQPGSDAYNMPATLRLQGALHVDALGEALNQVVRRHEALRTRLHYEDGRLAQVIVPELRVELPVEDFSSVENVPQATEEWLKAETRRPFDLERGPLLRAKLLKLSGREHILSVSMHHCVSDGWSLTIFFQELELFYNALAEGLPHSKLPPLPIQYGDFARWQRQWMQGSTLDAELAYWTQRLAGAPTETDLPTDHEPGEREAAPAGYETTQLSPETMRRLMALVQRERVTPFIVLMAGLALTLHKWTGQKDQVLGTVVAGRTRQELEPVIGCFMNFLPVRVRLQGNETRRHLLEKVRATVVEAQSHQDCPFEKMVEALNPERGRGQNPLYNVALLLQNYPNEYFQGDGLQASWIQTRWHAPLLDLRFEAEATSDGFSLLCEYRTDLFDRETIQALVASYQAVLEQLTDESDGPATQVTVRPDLLSQAKRSRSRKEKQTIGIAATFTVEPVEEALRYWMNELEIPASMQFAPYNQVFQELLDPRSLMSGNSRGLNVICIRLQDWAGAAEGDLDKAFRDSIERNVTEFIRSIKEASLRHPVPWLVVFCPGSLLVSGEPQHAELLEFTEQRVASELESVAGVQVVASRQLLDRYPVAEIEDASAEELGHVPFTPVFYTALATEIARRFHLLLRPPRKVIVLDCDHTLWSGVCGEDGPAGIRVDGPWREMQEFMRQQQEAGRLLCLCSKNNEQDVEEVLARRSDMPLRREHFAGVRLNWQPKSENLRALAQELQLGLDSFIFLDDNPVECAEVEANCPEVLTLQLPDEPQDIPRFLKHCWAFDQGKLTSEDLKRSDLYRQNRQREQLRGSMSLGDFLASLELKIEFAALTADSLARVAQLTQRTNQFNLTNRRRSEGELQQLRADTEVLTVRVSDRFGEYGLVGVMIYSVEGPRLDVDTFLLSCRVLGRGVEYQMLARLGKIATERGLDLLDVHYVQSERNKPALDFLDAVGGGHRQALNGGYVYRFPAAEACQVRFEPERNCPPAQPARPMPTVVAAGQAKLGASLARFPQCRTIALEAYDAVRIHARMEARLAHRVQGKRAGYVAPRTELERKLCEVWQRLLRVERVGVQENFFDLGGHSLLAVRLFAEIERLTGRKLPLVTLFQAATIEELNRVLSQDTPVESESLLVPIQPRGSRPPLILVHGAGGDVLWGYANLAAALGSEQPIYGLKSRGQVGREEFTRIQEMAACYLEQVRSFQPRGPYYLGGYCFGGNVAFEMARQLVQQGEKVAFLALLDSSPSNAGYEQIRWWSPRYAIRFSRNLGYWLKDFMALKAEERRTYFVRKARAFARKLKPGSANAVDLEEVIDLSHFSANELRLWQIHLQALVEHVDQPYEGDVVLLRTRGQPLFCSLEPDFCWSKLVRGKLEVKMVPGSHENVFMEPNVQALAAEIDGCLEQIRKGHTAAFHSQSAFVTT